MANYQEQLKKLAEQRAQREKAESAFDKFAAMLADCLMPLIEDGTITEAQASKVMVAICRGSITAKLDGRI